MIINISNCNNILSGTVSITEGRLNLKYAINGTGKSTIARAMESAAKHDEAALADLVPYSFIGDTRTEHQPSVEGLPEDIKVAVFDESYVNQYVFLDDELLKNSFDVFIKTPNYEQKLKEINTLIENVRMIFETNPDLDSLLKDMGEFIAVFGSNAHTGIANNGALVKGMKKGNLIQNIPHGLEDYSVFLQNPKNSKWLKWQESGREYMSLGDKCPFCASDLAPNRKKIERIEKEYDAKTIEHLSKILSLFEKLGHYFSEETNARIREIAQSVQGLSDEQRTYLVGIKKQVETFYEKLNQLKHLGFDLLKDVGRLADAIPSFKIEMQYLTHLGASFTIEKVNAINASIDYIFKKVGQLQRAVDQQKREIQNTVEKYCGEINAFLRNAGYGYTVSLVETPDHSYKLMLRYGDEENMINGVKKHLSFGERNAFALVLFMYHAIHENANLIILDDPISSFDKNKKFAILDMLFIRGGSLRGKTVLLLTHDFEPVIDAIYNHANYFEGTPIAHFMENNCGELIEQQIQKEDIISSLQVASENIVSSENIVCKLIYLRRKIEITEGKGLSWHMLSNLFHKRKIPMIGSDERAMNQEEFAEASKHIKEFITSFDYDKLYELISNREAMLNLYRKVQSKYEKLQIYRLLNEPTSVKHVIRKFLNETYHVENDYLFQLNPVKFNTVPNYIISECDRIIETEMHN